MSYLAVTWRPGAPEPGWLAALGRALPPGWTSLGVEGAQIALSGRRRGQVRTLAGGLLVGEIHGGVGGAGDRTALAAARSLCQGAWGGYVALLRDAGGGWGAFRDPSGALDCLTWRRGEAQIVTDEIPPWLDPWLPDEIGLDWDVVAGLVAQPVRQSAAVALRGVRAVAPGEFWSRAGGEQIWTPGNAARRPGPERVEALCVLPNIVDAVVEAQARGRVLIELSGGLDSAIVASALSPGAISLNYHVPDLGGDERAYARAVAERCGLRLIEAEKAAPRLDLSALAARSGGARPALNALDCQHDDDVAGRCRAMGVDTLITGQGGDHVFFQAPTALIAADELSRLSADVLAVLSRRLGCSAWSVLGQALRARWGRRTPPQRPDHVSSAAWDLALSLPAHPWLADLAGLPPAKALQAASLAASLPLQGASVRSGAASLRHPLLSQPVAEYCLSIAVPVLASGGRERGLARDAFTGRLPDCVVRRRGKGRLSSHYGRMIATGLEDLAPLLLEGRLAQEGLLDLEALSKMLSLEHLVWRGGYGLHLGLAAIELWVRAWEERLAIFAEKHVT